MRRLPLLFTVAAAVAACHHDPAPVTPVSNQEQPLQLVSYGGDDLAFVPIDADVVVGLNWARIRTSPLFTDLFAAKLAAVHDPSLDAFRSCGLDPITQITSVTIGLKHLKASTPEGTIIVHGLPRAKTEACLVDKRTTIEAGNTRMSVDHGLFQFDKGAKHTALMFVDDQTALAVIGPEGTRDGIKRLLGSSIAKSPAFAELHGKVNTRQAVWFLAHNKNGGLSNAMGFSIDAIFGNLDVTDGLSAEVHIDTPTTTGASQMSAMLKGQMASISPMVDKLDVTATGNDLLISVEMSEAKLRAMIGMMGGLFPSPAPPPQPFPSPTPTP